ncbi:MAG: hypothetical protein JWP35_351 [Caulobacter sp.]|nr:hypothetical protein [Caulobacter sp.]
MTIKRTLAWTLLASALIAAPAAVANDSTAELSTGGLVLTKTDAIEMRQEDLFISLTEVKVHYVFRNTSAADVTTTVAFPMPDITTDGIDDMIAIPTDDPQNILGFATLIDGKPVAMQVEQKAFKNGVDRTAYLKALGIPLPPHLDAANKAVDALPQVKKDEMVKLGLAAIDEFDAGKGWEKHWRASWTLKTTYHWTQTFPTGRDLIVEHRYTPSVGESSGTSLGSQEMANTPDIRAMKAKYCLDATFMAAVEKGRAAADANYGPYTEARIGYVLVTGANWKKPIGDFRLVVDKGAAENLVSFCATGVTKIAPTRFEVRKTNFTPVKDLSILILKPIHPDR